MLTQWLQTNTTKETIDRHYLRFDQEKNDDGTRKTTSASDLWKHLQNPEKDALWQQLCKEQGYICAYCGQSLDEKSKVRIEHLKVKSADIRGTFDYKNLVAVCDSTSNQEGMHCDVLREDKDISVYPTEAKCETAFYYLLNGLVDSKNNKEIEETIKVLGLNANENLVQDRKNYYNIANSSVKRYLTKNKFVKDKSFCESLNRLAQQLLVKHVSGNIAYREYCFVDYQIYKQNCPNLQPLLRNQK